MRRGCLTVVGLLLGLVVIGFVYLSLNPPFSLPETGYLSRATEVEARLDAANPTAAYEIHYGVPENVYASAYKEFPPLRLSATLVNDSPGSADMRLSVYPSDGLPLTDMQSSDDGAYLAWELDCETSGVRRECARDAILVLSGADFPANGLEATIRLFVEQPFPAHVPTPFLVSLDLSSDRVELPGGAQLLRGAMDASHDLSPGQPVVRWSLEVDAPQAPVMGSSLTVTVGHNGTPIPNGFQAPPPTAVALLDPTGEVIVTALIRPGSPATFALAPLAGEHTLVAWWQDHAVQSYDVSWRVEQEAIGSGPAPEVRIGEAQEPAPVEQVQVSGESETEPSGREQELADLNLGVLSGSPLAPNHVPSHLAIVQLHFTALTDSAAPVVLRANGAPVPLVPGATVETANGETMNCLGYSCRSGVSVSIEYGQSWIQFAWDGLVTLWPLDPAADHLR
jgi:hypothetical protein